MSDAGLLALLQWLSPTFPVGSYAYSQGLEWEISAGRITDGPLLYAWLSDSLQQGAARMDATLLAIALQLDSDLSRLAEYGEALASSRERHAETMEQGRAFGATVAALTGQAIAPMPYPVAVGAAARQLGLARRQVVALYLQTTVSSLIQVAVRFVPLGQTDGQRVLAALLPQIEATALAVEHARIEALGSAGLRADLASLRHETMEVRRFRT